MHLSVSMNRTVPKKISAAVFSADGRYAIFADKFGDVHVAVVAAQPDQQPAAHPATLSDQKSGTDHHVPELLLGHFCSIITDLAVSPDGRYVVSTDRDHKIRVSIMPPNPMQVIEAPPTFSLHSLDAR